MSETKITLIMCAVGFGPWFVLIFGALIYRGVIG